MQSIYIIQEQLGHRSSSEWMLKWNEMTKLGKLVNDNQNGVSRT